MKVREYNKLKDEAAGEYQRKLDAIETVWKMSGGVNTNGLETPTQGRGALLTAARQALTVISGEFTVRDIERRIKTNNPSLTVRRASLSSTLKRLDKREGLIKILERGSGKRPTRYQKKSEIAA